jgi:hypothetical protein
MADDPKKQMASDGSIRGGSGQFVKKKDLVKALKESNKETNKESREANATAKMELDATLSNTQQLIDNATQASIISKEQERADNFIKTAADKQVAIQSGEYGFKGLFKNAKENIKQGLMMDKTFSEGFAEVGQALSQDLQFLGSMLSPLTAIPGVSTALTFLKFAGGNLLKLATVEGRLAAKTWIAQKKKWAWDKLQAAKNSIMNRGAQLKKDGVKGSLKKGGNALFKLFTKLFRGVAIVILGILAFVFAFFKSIGSQLGKLLSGPWNKIKSVFSKFRPKWANAKSIGKVFSGPWDKIKNLFGKIKIPAGITNTMNMVKGFFGSVKGGVGSAFSKIKSLLTPVQKVIAGLMKSPIVGFMGRLGATLGRFFIPLTILMGAWQSIKGLIDGWKNTEGTWGDKIIGGLAGVVENLINFFIWMPTDLLKDLLAWLGEKLGLIGPETKAMINDFSFADIFSKLWEGLVNIGLAIKNWVGAVLAGAWAGIKAAWPGGESPMGAFKRVYNEKLAGGGGTYKSTGLSGGSETGEMVEAGSKENKRAEDELDSDRAKSGSAGGNVNAVTSNTNINQASKTIQVNNSGPSDSMADLAGAMP